MVKLRVDFYNEYNGDLQTVALRPAISQVISNPVAKDYEELREYCLDREFWNQLSLLVVYKQSL
jgi:hypothetical protein